MRTALSKTSSSRRKGFTLIELMVTLLVGSIAISSFYSVSRSSTLFFEEQTRIGNLQTRVQQAIDQVKRDLRLAGHMAAANLETAPEARRCNVTAPPFSAANLTAGGLLRFLPNSPATLVSGIDPAGLYGADPDVGTDEVWLLGNFETYASYGSLDFNPSNDSVVVLNSASNYAAQRRFTNWQNGAPTALDNAAFEAAFKVGGPVALKAPSGKLHLAVLTAVDTTGFATGGGVRFTFTPRARGVNGDCKLGGGRIAPLQAIQYQVTSAAEAAANGNPAAIRDRANLLDQTDPLPQLHRRELDLLAGAPMAGGEDRVVLDYVINFRLTFATDGGTLNPLDRDVIDWSGNNALATANPETIRGVRIELSARSPGQDRNLSSGLPGNLRSPLEAFVIDQNRRGAAHVRTMRADIFMPNMAASW